MTVPLGTSSSAESGSSVSETAPSSGHLYREAAPNIEAWLDDIGLDVYAFRLLARISRRAGRSGVCNESVPNMAHGCGMEKRTAQYRLRYLVETGYVAVAQAPSPRSTTRYILAPKMHLQKAEKDKFVALFVPGWLDELDLDVYTFRLLYHYLRLGWQGPEILTNHAYAERTTGMSPKKVRDAESKLLESRLFLDQGRQHNQRVLMFNFVTVHAKQLSDAPHPVTKIHPTRYLIHAEPSSDAAKGLYEVRDESREVGDSSSSKIEDLRVQGQGYPRRFKSKLTSAELFFKECSGDYFVSKVNDSETLQHWRDKFGDTFILRAAELSNDPNYQEDGVLPVYLFEDWLYGSRVLPPPLLELVNERWRVRRDKNREYAEQFDFTEGSVLVDTDNCYMRVAIGPETFDFAEIYVWYLDRPDKTELSCVKLEDFKFLRKVSEIPNSGGS